MPVPRRARTVFWVIRVPFVFVWRPKSGMGDVTNMALGKASHVICCIMLQFAVIRGKSHETPYPVP